MDAALKLKLMNAFLVSTANLASMEDAPKTYDALSRMTGFVRYLFCKDGVALLSRELAMLDDYLRLMSLSSPLPIRYEVAPLPPACEQCVPALYLIEEVDVEIEKAFQTARRSIQLRISLQGDGTADMAISLDGGAYVQTRMPPPDTMLTGGGKCTFNR